ncbi:hypothetical protein BHE74_00024483 [Ensete ventricosum]|uniref:Uncharacterized protein n=1 Tax=Ensete ventricosum TaxID=4639 RepID=A0A444C8P6_ENSVE|nr:hypothetical protein GW17_00056257 [Ensete ventricosum]RWW68025.1 hypothetical protein BHE74_00024483 [Ensete ventricosum]RZR72153.1 hypothetical protein BHM03_00010863 [Ensete ventricosum]
MASRDRYSRGRQQQRWLWLHGLQAVDEGGSNSNRATVMAMLQRCETVDLKKAASDNGVQVASRSLLRFAEGSIDCYSRSVGDVHRLMRVRLMIATTKMVRNYSKVVEMIVLLAATIEVGRQQP